MCSSCYFVAFFFSMGVGEGFVFFKRHLLLRLESQPMIKMEHVKPKVPVGLHGEEKPEQCDRIRPPTHRDDEQLSLEQTGLFGQRALKAREDRRGRECGGGAGGGAEGGGRARRAQQRPSDHTHPRDYHGAEGEGDGGHRGMGGPNNYGARGVA